MEKSFFVSLSGNDANPGTWEQPFCTLEKARDAVRSFCKAKPQETDIIVWLENGTYRQEKPLRLSPEDGGSNGHRIVYRAAEEARPEIAGSIAVTGWEACDFDPSIYKASVPVNTQSRQLYVNGHRATRARTDDYPEGFLPHYKETKKEIKDGHGGIYYKVSPFNNKKWRDPAAWGNLDCIDAVLETQWKMMSVPLLALNKKEGIISLQTPAWDNANLYHSQKSCCIKTKCRFLKKLLPVIKKKKSGPGIWSLWRITRFENALEFLTDPGEWYLDSKAGMVYYKPLAGEDIQSARVELPVLESLLEIKGTENTPVTDITFEGLIFSYATWLEPGTNEGYVSDQSGFRVIGSGHPTNLIGHVKDVVKTPGNIRLEFAHNIQFTGNTFSHIGCVGIDLGTGSKHNSITSNFFFDISSAAVQIGDVTVYKEAVQESWIVSGNSITQNRIDHAAVEYIDAAGIFSGFTEYTIISHNIITNVHWSGIAMGWGWGLLDADGYPGLESADWYHWGKDNHHTINRHNKITDNHIEHFLLTAWDGGAVYTTGYQGTCMDDALVIQGNTAVNKKKEKGGNVFYTDGGSRWILLLNNHSAHNHRGHVDFGPAPKDPFVYLKYKELSELLFEYFSAAIANHISYGGDIGGCRTYGDIEFIGNTGISTDFYNICPYKDAEGTTYPVNMVYDNNNNDAKDRAVGGASYPPLLPVNSWHIPRLSLPGIMGLQFDYCTEWWYFGGIVTSTSGRSFSITFLINRAGLEKHQIAVGMLGIGWRDKNGKSFELHALNMGIGADQGTHNPSILSSLVSSPVSDSVFKLTYKPLIAIVKPSGSLLHHGITVNGSDEWNISYTGGNILGAENSTYNLSGSGKGYRTIYNTKDTKKMNYELSLSVTAHMGMVMENKSGVVGNSYECALPVLEVTPGTGYITIGNEKNIIKNGLLWMDRQMLAGTIGSGNIPLSEEKHLLSWIMENRRRLGKSTLYVGNWMGLTLQNRISLVLVEFWKSHENQWISGTSIKHPDSDPQPGGFGNIYFSKEYAEQTGNGGMFLRPRLHLTQSKDDWDYDINLLHPEDPENNSPHWKSPQSGNTYATAWHIEFSPALQVKGLPDNIYLFVLCDNTEIVVTPDSAFFEGAALIYSNAEQTGKSIGQAFVEQMGYN